MRNRPAPTQKRLNALATKAQFLAIFIAAITLTGCVAYLTTPYYRPSAPEGRLRRAMQPATKSVIVFNRQGVLIGLNTAENSSNQLVATLSFEVPSNTTVQLQDRHLLLTLESGETQTCTLSGWIWTGPGRTAPFSPDSIMTGDSIAWRFGTAMGFAESKYAAYFFAAPLFPMARHKAFRLTLPKVRIDRTEHMLPTVSFTLDSEKLWTPLL